MNSQEELVRMLKSGEINLTNIDIAVMVWINARTDIPEGIKNLLVAPSGGGVIRELFMSMKHIIGACELSYRRGVQEGNE